MISYAQNLEDVVINRIFQNKPKGFYIDVGAHDPVEFSVTKHFYDLGWRGINIEPVPSSFEKFQRQRPDEINLNIAVGSQPDFATIYEIDGHPELTTLDKSVAKATAKHVQTTIKPYTIEIRTLVEICDRYCTGPIDFMKIDVEGYEREAILGTDFQRFRPRMLAIEATEPCSAIITDWQRPSKAGTWEDWESLILRNEYLLAYYDGLNRFYLRKEDKHLKNRFAIPITPLQDGFSLYHDIQDAGHIDSEDRQLKKKKGSLTNKLDQLKNRESHLARQVSEASQAIDDLRMQRCGLIHSISKNELKFRTVVATLREARLSIRRNPFLKLLLPVFHRQKAPNKEYRPSSLQKENVHLRQAIQSLGILRRDEERFPLGWQRGIRPKCKTLEKSGLFYRRYYADQISDLAVPDSSSVKHYLLYGAWEDKDPNPMFSSSFYLVKYQDVYLARINPLLHYVQHGWKEGRDPHPEFSTERYLIEYPDVKKSGMNPLLHYLVHGILEGRKIYPST